MAVHSPENFSHPNPFARNGVRPGSVRPPVLFVQGPFALIFMLVQCTIYYMAYEVMHTYLYAQLSIYLLIVPFDKPTIILCR